VFSRDFTVLPAVHTHTFIRHRNEPYLPLPSQPQLAVIYRPRRDGRLSSLSTWCEVAPAEIRTCNLPIANPALYHTATSANRSRVSIRGRPYIFFLTSSSITVQNLAVVSHTVRARVRGPKNWGTTGPRSIRMGYVADPRVPR